MTNLLLPGNVLHMTLTNEPLETDKKVRLAVAAEIRGWLGKRRHSQAWLAQELGLGRAAIVKKLAGDQSFSLEQLVLTAAAFDITLGQLLGEDILNAKSPRPAMRDEDSGQLPQLDSNQQPLD